MKGFISGKRNFINISEHGANKEMLEALADATILLPGGYRKFDLGEVIGIF